MKKLLVLATVSLFVFSACDMGKKFEPLGGKAASTDPINSVMTEKPVTTSPLKIQPAKNAASPPRRSTICRLPSSTARRECLWLAMANHTA